MVLVLLEPIIPPTPLFYAYISLLMYADDMVALSNSIEGLLNTLDLMYDYCQTWKLTVNLTKTNVLVCKYAGRRKMDDLWFWGDQIIDNCDIYKYFKCNI